jgi:hypothetical protein
MIAETINYFSLVEQMPQDTLVIFHGVTWAEYEELLAQVGESNALRISFNDGTLKVMTLSPEHEKYAEFLKTTRFHSEPQTAHQYTFFRLCHNAEA